MNYAEKNQEAEIIMIFLETHDLSLDDYDLEDIMYEYQEDYLEFREWHLAYCA